MRYRYYTNKNKVVCLTHFAGKPVRGVAICSDKDSFNYETGMELARARADFKVEGKRLKCAQERLDKAYEELNRLKNQLHEAEMYLHESMNKERDSFGDLIRLEIRLGLRDESGVRQYNTNTSLEVDRKG